VIWGDSAMQRALTTVLTLCVLATGAPTVAAACPAEGFIQNAGAAFMGAARLGSAGAFTGAASRYADLHSIALFALGPYRRNMPKAREREYVNLTVNFIGRFMAQYASHFSGTGITITSCAGNLVGTKLSTGQALTFRLRKAGASYRVEDVSVSSIWLAQTMRSKFTGVISHHGGDVEALMNWLGS
jgi:phospholipid transport system substrate-binding protein